jgi:hypothetical protein
MKHPSRRAAENGGFTGYALPTRIANGIHTRLSACAFVIGELLGDERLS